VDPVQTHYFSENLVAPGTSKTTEAVSGWVCSLQLLLVLASAVILKSESQSEVGSSMVRATPPFPCRSLTQRMGGHASLV
jgi:hypothetical protein